MNDAAPSPLEAILRYCAAADPSPWYPSVHARENSVPRDSLDPPLDQLRMANLIRLTDWVKDLGQGYVLTELGKQVLNDPRRLDQVRKGKVPAAPVAESRPPVERRGHFSTWDRGEAVREALLNPAPPLVSRLLLWANILVFLYGMVLASQQNVPVNLYVMGDSSEILHQLGMLTANDLILGQWWRLLTCCFVHIGFWHIGMNMYALYIIGPIGERLWGRLPFLVMYLIAGIAGACAGIISNPAGLAGASGALCGIIAAEAVWVFLNRAYIPSSLLSAWMRQLLITFLLIAFISSFRNVSGAGHLGGAVAGVLVGLLLSYFRFGTPLQRLLALLGIVAVPVLSIAMVLQTMSSNPLWRAQDWNLVIRPRIDDILDAMDDAYRDQVEPLLLLDAAERDPARVQEALATLATMQAQAEQGLRLVEQAGPYSEPQTEAQRRHQVANFKFLIGRIIGARKELEQPAAGSP